MTDVAKGAQATASFLGEEMIHSCSRSEGASRPEADGLGDQHQRVVGILVLRHTFRKVNVGCFGEAPERFEKSRSFDIKIGIFHVLELVFEGFEQRRCFPARRQRL
jgi:hypothetical protein